MINSFILCLLLKTYQATMYFLFPCSCFCLMSPVRGSSNLYIAKGPKIFVAIRIFLYVLIFQLVFTLLFVQCSWKATAIFRTIIARRKEKAWRISWACESYICWLTCWDPGGASYWSCSPIISRTKSDSLASQDKGTPWWQCINCWS